MSLPKSCACIPRILRRQAAPQVRTSCISFNFDHRRHISAFGYTQSKALVFSKYGEPKDVLGLHSYSISPPHNTQCTVRLLTAPLNPADINQIQGVYPSKPRFTTELGTQDPHAVPGNEGAFEVLSTGAGVKNIKNGDWVIMKRTGMGTWRTHAQFDESELLKIDNTGLTPLQVGTVGVNPVTAYRMIKDFCNWDWMRSGEEWMIQNGANSGVGRAAIQLAREWGIKTINVVRERETPAETQALKDDLVSLGATVVITESELLASSKLREITREVTRQGKEPIRLALNCVGGNSASALAKVLAPSSSVVTYGAMAKQPLKIPSGLLIFKDISFKGFWVSQWGNKNPAMKEDTIKDILRMTRAGTFKDIPVQEIKWKRDTQAEELSQMVQGTLSGFRSGKGVFVYEGD